MCLSWIFSFFFSVFLCFTFIHRGRAKHNFISFNHFPHKKRVRHILNSVCFMFRFSWFHVHRSMSVSTKTTVSIFNRKMSIDQSVSASHSCRLRLQWLNDSDSHRALNWYAKLIQGRVMCRLASINCRRIARQTQELCEHRRTCARTNTQTDGL